MKRFFQNVFLLLIPAGLIFWFGWVSFSLSAGESAVIHTKTNGYETGVIQSGEFVWRLDALLPTNLTLYKFPNTPRNLHVSRKALLPSGIEYASLLPGSVDFSLSLDSIITYRIKPDYLPELVARKGLVPEHMQEWLDAQEKSMGESALTAISEAVKQNSVPGTSLEDTTLQTMILKNLEDQFPFIDFTDMTIIKLQIPDPELYSKARNDYFKILEAKSASETIAVKEQAQATVTKRTDLLILEEYGKLLTEYPILVDYLSLGAPSSADVMKRLQDIAARYR